jgi:hypothetical protein
MVPRPEPTDSSSLASLPGYTPLSNVEVQTNDNSNGLANEQKVIIGVAVAGFAGVVLVTVGVAYFLSRRHSRALKAADRELMPSPELHLVEPDNPQPPPPYRNHVADSDETLTLSGANGLSVRHAADRDEPVSPQPSTAGSRTPTTPFSMTKRWVVLDDDRR